MKRILAIATAAAMLLGGQLTAFAAAQPGQYDVNFSALRADASAAAASGPSAKAEAYAANAQEIIRLTNQERSRLGLHPLAVDETLMEAAALRARELSVSYSHTRPNGESAASWVRSITDYGWGAENIAMGHPSAQAVTTAWIQSEDHHSNLTHQQLNIIGVGCYQDEYGILYWVQLFAS